MPDRYFVDIPKSVNKELQRIPSPWLERIERAIDELEANPFAGIKMAGQLADKRKLKVWPYRVLYTINKDTRVVRIYEIGHRGSVSYD